MSRVQDVYPEGRVSLREVGLRDGLQLVKTFPSTAAKQRWLREEYAAGVRHFEVGSFLPAKTFPQFADVRDIVAAVAALPGAHGIALVLNERGANEALASGVAEIASVVRNRGAQPGQCQPLAGVGDRQCEAALRVARRQHAQADRACGNLDGARLLDFGRGRSERGAASGRKMP